ncbi:RmlC-like cupin domain-containing protein [Powellomyces hirtus]|nr:RmlC-like cupin domain-containing protein [Powellomyces hirtus]
MSDLPKRAQELIKRLDLQPHPEGGFFRETFRSSGKTGEAENKSLSSIYFLITAGNVSRFHRIQSDECWYFHEGSAVTIHILDQQGHRELPLGPDIEKGDEPFRVVSGKTIFGSCLRDDHGYALVSCAVAPAFDFHEYELFKYEDLIGDYPQCEFIIKKMT